MLSNNRWRIEGYLTTKSPLHVGSGFVTTHPDLGDGNDLIEITAVQTDVNGCAYIPGTSIKGTIRSWLDNCGVNPAIIEQLFGSEDMNKRDAVGGKAEFWNAYAVTLQNIAYAAPYWRRDRLTDVTVSVSIDRYTKTAIEQKLFHQEFVPPGIKFGVTITAQNASDEEITTLVYALKYGFSDENAIVIGASTSNGWGRLEWELRTISKIDQFGIKKWLDEGAPAIGSDAFLPLSEKEFLGLMEKMEAIKTSVLNSHVKVRLKLKFKGTFLVNDTSQVNDETADHLPRRNHEGKIVLPAESFRGAFRSQAERIIRTVGGIACGPAIPCKGVKRIEEVEELCLACQVFGASGWKSGVSFTDFVICVEKDPIRQEFVAIDRFTGGGAEGLKFSAEAVPEPELEGIIFIDMARINPCGLGLFALTYRDLTEGDITFGFGSSKGYGACEADIISITPSATLPAMWIRFIGNLGLKFETLKLHEGTTIDENRLTFLNACVEEFRKTIAERQGVSYA